MSGWKFIKWFNRPLGADREKRDQTLLQLKDLGMRDLHQRRNQKLSSNSRSQRRQMRMQQRLREKLLLL